MTVSDSHTGSALKLPEQLEPFLALLGPLPVCLSCESAVLPKSVMDHLRKHHHLPVELRGSVRSLVATLPPLDFDDVPIRPNDSEPVEAIRVVDAFQCKQCPFIRRDVTDVRKHINQEHNTSAGDNYSKIQAQSWFGGRRAVYWRVHVPTAEDMEKDKFERENTRALCEWGLLTSRGFGHMQPKSWREGEHDPPSTGWTM